ncbi:MAG: LytTR family DNA-binding domain-containing protein [Campylobacterota bacterium]|nr:LytTR family DNA-binding domain-containing protein [Campylobacterota bacterium]
MKILIVDDEALALARLKRMLNTLGYTDIIEAESAIGALEAIKKQHFDLVLLDINMPQTSGLELGYELRYHQENLSIIFQTAYDEHALKAYDIGAVGYLVKPFSMEQLQQSIERVKLEKINDTKHRLMSKNGENYYLFKPEEIYYVKADLSEVMLRSIKGFSYYAHKISDLEKQLLSHDFVRIHRSYLININKIKEMETIEQSKLRFSFKDISDQIESSKDGAKAFRNQFTS